MKFHLYKKDTVAQPCYDLEVVEASGKELLGKSFFTSELLSLKCGQGEATIALNTRDHAFKANTIFTNQQIADKLNFPDQATFGQFFKRNGGDLDTR